MISQRYRIQNSAHFRSHLRPKQLQKLVQLSNVCSLSANMISRISYLRVRDVYHNVILMKLAAFLSTNTAHRGHLDGSTLTADTG